MTPKVAPGPVPASLTVRDVYLPIVGSPPGKPEGEPTIFDNPKATAFYGLLIGDPRQERPALTPCPALILAAGWRARGLATGDPFAHCDAGGMCANEYARQAGCRLPPAYAAKGNNIESLVAGTDNVQVAFDALATSPAHRDHLFGRGDFFQAQRHAGIALVERLGSPFRYYWVVLIGICEEVSGE